MTRLIILWVHEIKTFVHLKREGWTFPRYGQPRECLSTFKNLQAFSTFKHDKTAAKQYEEKTATTTTLTRTKIKWPFLCLKKHKSDNICRTLVSWWRSLFFFTVAGAPGCRCRSGCCWWRRRPCRRGRGGSSWPRSGRGRSSWRSRPGRSTLTAAGGRGCGERGRKHKLKS